MEVVLVKHTATGSSLHPCEGERDGDDVILRGVEVAPAIADEIQVEHRTTRITSVVAVDASYRCRCDKF